jgi:hypothetical protein
VEGLVKKTISVIFSILFVLGLLTVDELNPVKAKSDEPTAVVPAIAAGSWTALTGAGTDLDVTQSALSAPSWLQLLSSTGIKVTTPGKMCYPFRGGSYGWVPQIHQYKSGEWTKLATTAEWVPNSEGELMACANVSAAGTYALFGYYKAPQAKAVVEPTKNATKEVPFDCDSIVLTELNKNNSFVSNTPTDNFYLYEGNAVGVPIGKTITIRIDAANSIPNTLSETPSVTTIQDGTGYFIVTSVPHFSFEPTSVQLIYELPDYGCTYTIPFAQ